MCDKSFQALIFFGFYLITDTADWIINLHKKIKFFSVIAKYFEARIEYRIKFIGITAVNLTVIFVFLNEKCAIIY